MRRRHFLAAAGVAATAGTAGCATPFGDTHEEEFTETYPADERTALSVFAHNGDVTVTGTDRDDVRVDAVKRATGDESDLDRVRIEVSEEFESITVRVDRDEENPPDETVSVDLDIGVPAGMDINNLSTTNGDVDLEDAGGDADLEYTGDTRLQTENGDLRAVGVEGFPSLETTNGDVTVEGGRGVTWAATTNGDVDVEMEAFPARESITLHSTNGDVTASVPEDLDANVTLVTGTGEAEVVDLSLSDTTTTWTLIEGVLGEGGPTFGLESTTGDVTLRRLE